MSRNLEKKIAIVVSNPAISTTTNSPTGFWWSELTHPYYEFIKAGYEVEIFSNDGGKTEADAMSDPRDQSGYSANDLVTMGFISTDRLVKQVENTKKVSEIDVNAFDAIVVAGGQGPMYTYDKAVDLHSKFVEFFEADKVVAALCHGVAVLKFAKLSNGEFLAKGKTVTGFTNAEEDYVDHSMWQYNLLPQGKSYTPWRIEDAVKETGANYVHADLWQPFAVRDGNIVTGQQNFSGAETAHKVIEALEN